MQLFTASTHPVTQAKTNKIMSILSWLKLSDSKRFFYQMYFLVSPRQHLERQIQPVSASICLRSHENHVLPSLPSLRRPMGELHGLILPFRSTAKLKATTSNACFNGNVPAHGVRCGWKKTMRTTAHPCYRSVILFIHTYIHAQRLSFKVGFIVQCWGE